MINKLNDALHFHSSALRLRSERQQVLAANIANADTPGYKAADFDFGRALAGAVGAGDASTARMVATNPGHLAPRTGSAAQSIQYRIPTQSSVDGNSVEMDTERANFADNAIRYEASLRFLNGQIKSIMSAITG